MADENILTHHGQSVTIRYKPSIDGPDRCLIAIGGLDLEWPLPDIMDTVSKLKDGKAVTVAGIRAKTPGFADWLISHDMAMPMHRTVGPLPRHIAPLNTLYADLKDLRGKLERNEIPIPDGQYIAVIRASAVRDVQYDSGTESDPGSDAWTDLPDAEIYLGLFAGPKADAVAKAAEYAGTHPDNIRLIPV